jgi:hypothetical protein
MNMFLNHNAELHKHQRAKENGSRRRSTRAQYELSCEMQGRPKNVVGESGDTTLENENFTLPLDFLTQNRRAIINGPFEKCGRRPVTVLVRLVDDSQNRTFDSLSLDFAKDFKLVTEARML